MEPIRVMVVDDAADARFLVSLILRDAEGIDVVAEADSADTALERLDGIDVVLCDARMPMVDGYELTRRMLAVRPGLRVALLTSVVDTVIESQAREAGAAAAWSKGDMDALPDRIRALAG